MNKQFAEVAARYVKAAPSLTHAQEVTRLYRHSLKLLMSWAIDHEVIAEEAEKIREQFDANKDLPPNSGYVLCFVFLSLSFSTLQSLNTIVYRLFRFIFIFVPTSAFVDLTRLFLPPTSLFFFAAPPED